MSAGSTRTPGRRAAGLEGDRMRSVRRALTMLLLCAAAVPLAGAGVRASVDAGPQRGLDIYFIDVEGGQSTLIVTPAREALLVDAGYPGQNGRDPARILAAIRDAG